MSQFVEECRREWRRLRVPEPIANEMAADLEADLKEAEAEGASPEEVLGSSAFDPRSFAATWAAERGVIHLPPTGDRPHRRPAILAAIAAFAVIAAIGATLAIFASPAHVSESMILASRSGARHALVPTPPLPASENISGTDPRAIGRTLLIVGSVGIILSMLFLFWSSWAGPGHWSRRRTYIDEGSGGAGLY